MPAMSGAAGVSCQDFQGRFKREAEHHSRIINN